MILEIGLAILTTLALVGLGAFIGHASREHEVDDSYAEGWTDGYNEAWSEAVQVALEAGLRGSQGDTD